MAYQKKNEHGLTDQQQAFVNAYVTHFNASQAAREAGYTEKNCGSAGCSLLKNPNVNTEIRRIRGEALARTDLKVEDLIKKLQEIIFVDPRSTVADELRAVELAGRYMGMWDGAGAPKRTGDRDRKNTAERILAAFKNRAG